jgi:hypothetical protein
MNRIRIGQFIQVVICILLCSAYLFTTVGCSAVLMNDATRKGWENKCRLELGGLVKLELEFQEKNKNHDFGTWEELIYPHKDYLRWESEKDTFIINYVIVVFDVNKSTLNEKGESNGDSTFLIVAKRKYPWYNLSPFAIDQNQIPYMWIGQNSQWEEGKTKLDDRNLWKPLN